MVVKEVAFVLVVMEVEEEEAQTLHGILVEQNY